MVPQIKTGTFETDEARESPVNGVPATPTSVPMQAGRRSSVGDFIGGGMDEAADLGMHDEDGMEFSPLNVASADGDAGAAEKPDRGHHMGGFFVVAFIF